MTPTSDRPSDRPSDPNMESGYYAVNEPSEDRDRDLPAKPQAKKAKAADADDDGCGRWYDEPGPRDTESAL